MITIERTQHTGRTTWVKVYKDENLILDESASGAETNSQAHGELEDIIRVVKTVAESFHAEITEILTTIK